jgi:hypothetical protein
MKIIKVIKWALILIIVFVSAVLAGPFYTVACWIDHEGSEKWLDGVGDGLFK